MQQASAMEPGRSSEQTVLSEIRELRAQNDEMLRRMDAFYKLLEVSVRPSVHRHQAVLSRVSPNQTGRSNSAPLEVIEETLAEVNRLQRGSDGGAGAERLPAVPPLQGRGLSAGSAGSLGSGPSDLRAPRSEQPRVNFQALASGRSAQGGFIPFTSRNPTARSDAAAPDPKTFDVQNFHEAVLRCLVGVRSRNPSKDTPPLRTSDAALPGAVADEESDEEPLNRPGHVSIRPGPDSELTPAESAQGLPPGEEHVSSAPSKQLTPASSLSQERFKQLMLAGAEPVGPETFTQPTPQAEPAQMGPEQSGQLTPMGGAQSSPSSDLFHQLIPAEAVQPTPMGGESPRSQLPVGGVLSYMGPEPSGQFTPAGGTRPSACGQLLPVGAALSYMGPEPSMQVLPSASPSNQLLPVAEVQSLVGPERSGRAPVGGILSNPDAGGGNPNPRRTNARVAWSEEVQAVDVARHAPGHNPNEAPRTGAIIRKSSSIDEMRRRVDVEIVRNISTTNVVDALEMPQDSRHPVRVCLLGAQHCALDCVARSNYWGLRVGGLLPWSTTYLGLSASYQWAVILVNVGILCGLALQTRLVVSNGTSEPFLVGDMVLAGGCVAGLFASGAATGSTQLREILSELEDLNMQQSFTQVVDSGNAIDSILTLAAWLLFLSDRLGAVHVLSSQGLAGLSLYEALRLAAVFLASAQLAILVLVVLRLIRNMTGLINGFCLKFLEGMEYTSAPDCWNRVQANLRLASSAVERTFAILLSLLVLLALALPFDLQPLRGTLWALTASLGLILMTSQVLLRAAAVTDACIRISQLVNATGVSDQPMDMERKYLVEYISASAAGFYVFNVRLGAGLAMKVFHYTGLMVFTLARLVLPATSQF